MQQRAGQRRCPRLHLDQLPGSAAFLQPADRVGRTHQKRHAVARRDDERLLLHARAAALLPFASLPQLDSVLSRLSQCLGVQVEAVGVVQHELSPDPDVNEAVASGSSAPEAGAYSWIFGSAPQQAAPRSEVSTFGVVTERDEETADGTKHKRKSMAL